MDKILQAYEQLIQNLVSWAQTQEYIRLVFVLGERFRRCLYPDRLFCINLYLYKLVDPRQQKGFLLD